MMNLYHFENVSRETMKGVIKMIKVYAVVHTEKADNGYVFVGASAIRELFTNKGKARAEAHRLNAWKKAVNGLRKAEGSRERITGTFIVVSLSLTNFDDIPHGIINVKNWGDEI
jgi:hypothetical protein